MLRPGGGGWRTRYGGGGVLLAWPRSPPVAGAVCARCPLLTHPPPIISSILLLTITASVEMQGVEVEAAPGSAIEILGL